MPCYCKRAFLKRQEPISKVFRTGKISIWRYNPDHMSATSSKHIESLDFVRGLAIIHIVIYHYYLEWFHGGFLVTPDHVAQNLQVFGGGGLMEIVKNIFSFLFLYGFTSVNVFLLLSGFVLTLSLLSTKDQKIRWCTFLWKRIKRLLIPLYLSIALGIGILYLRNVLFPSLGGPPLFNWIDLLKLFFFPLFLFDYSLLQRFNGDYWYIPLILQLSVLFPLLFLLLKRIGPKYFIVLMLGITVLYRFFAVYGASFGFSFLDAVPMGVLSPSQRGYYGFGFFLPRLFEFAAGMFLAHHYVSTKKFFDRLVTKKWFLASVLLTLLGFTLLYFRWGWIFSDQVIAVGLTLFFLNFGVRLARLQFFRKFLKKMSESAYETYLLHHYLLNYFLLPFLLTMGWYQEAVFWIFLPVYFVLIIITGRLSFRLTGYCEKAVRKYVECRTL